MVKELKIYLPDELYARMMSIEKKHKITIQDILLRTIVKTIEEFEK